ncbi:MAG: tetratricopeptide repeat protein [Piscinibacter sp.]|uniref:YfgM family protein n=1 Tax=Piscinibacter sp. TaxID=1903157 RepID=UPI0025910224|nr:tetratricopeptide repeat protein [Piscinibacter sp.]MCW5664331.1 tetratricopeptide repeat protein [Piscinibacter sp.]
MATHLDLEEQEQLDQLKAFWKQYGNAIVWLLTLVLAGFAAWNGWNWWQREQAVKAGAMFDELDRAVQAGEAARAAGVFKDMQERFPRTAFTQQGGLATARVQFEKGELDAAAATLGWVAEHAVEDEYKTVARLRLAGVLADQKKYDEALKQLDGASAKEFEALVADRRGDVLMAMGRKDEAKAAWQKAWSAMDAKVEYRRLIDAKLTAIGAAPAASAPAAGGAAR